MATRFKSTDLKEMIRTLVRQEILESPEIRGLVQSEIKEVVAKTINEVLSERYLKEVAARVVEAARPQLRETLMGITPEPEEETPGDYENTNKGVYHKNPLVKTEPKKINIPEALRKNNPLAFIYEDVDPSEDEPAAPLPVDEEQTQKWASMVERIEQKTKEKSQVQKSEAQILRELEEKRKALETPVNAP